MPSSGLTVVMVNPPSGPTVPRALSFSSADSNTTWLPPISLAGAPSAQTTLPSTGWYFAPHPAGEQGEQTAAGATRRGSLGHGRL